MMKNNQKRILRTSPSGKYYSMRAGIHFKTTGNKIVEVPASTLHKHRVDGEDRIYCNKSGVTNSGKSYYATIDPLNNPHVIEMFKDDTK